MSHENEYTLPSGITLNTAVDSDGYLYHKPSLTKEDLMALLHSIELFYQNPQTPQLCLETARTTAALITENIPQVQAIMGSGYPYYMVDPPIASPPEEFLRYLAVELMPKAAHSNDIGFTCPDCLKKNLPAHLSILCEHCSASFQAIDMFRVLPDIDMILVLDKLTIETAAPVAQALDALDLFHGNEDLDKIIFRTDTYIKSVLNNTPPDRHTGGLHTELLLTDVPTLDKSFKSIAQGDLKQAGICYITRRYPKRSSWFFYHDEFAEDIFLSGPTFLVDKIGLKQRLQNAVSRFTHLEDSQTVYDRYLQFLQHHTDAKYYRLITSSPRQNQAVKARIEAARFRIQNPL